MDRAFNLVLIEENAKLREALAKEVFKNTMRSEWEFQFNVGTLNLYQGAVPMMETKWKYMDTRLEVTTPAGMGQSDACLAFIKYLCEHTVNLVPQGANVLSLNCHDNHVFYNAKEFTVIEGSVVWDYGMLSCTDM
jgi:hypothetical protein